MIKMINWSLLFLIFLPLFTSDLRAGPPGGYIHHSPGSICLYQAVVSLKKTWKDSLKELERSIELEIGIDPVLPHITTEDGTMSSLVKHYGDGWFLKLFPGKDPKNVTWQGQSVARKKEILNAITSEQEFFSNRKILGIQLKKDNHPFSEFQNYVELRGPEDSGNVNGFELHMRGKERASALALKVRAAAKKAGVEKTSLHAHITLKIRTASLMEDPFVDSLRHGDFIRRNELFAQMHSLFETSDDLSPVKIDNVAYFYPLDGPDKIYIVMRGFMNKGLDGKKVPLNLPREKSYVGTAGEAFYDVEKVYGIEVRAINKKMSNSSIEAMLDGMESSGGAKYFGHTNDRVGEWVKKQIPKPKGKKGSEDYIDDSAAILFDVSKKLYPNFKMSRLPTIEHLNAPELLIWKQMSKVPDSHRLRLILHNWGEDLLFYDSPDTLAKIKMARISAMRKLVRGEGEREVTREFLLDSGIYKRLGDSLGIKVDILEP